VKCLMEQPGEQKQTWALIKTLHAVSRKSFAKYTLRTYSLRRIRLHRPPEKSFFSTTVTWHPAAASRAAVATPPAPAPTMITFGRQALVLSAMYSPIANILVKSNDVEWISSERVESRQELMFSHDVLDDILHRLECIREVSFTHLIIFRHVWSVMTFVVSTTTATLGKYTCGTRTSDQRR